MLGDSVSEIFKTIDLSAVELGSRPSRWRGGGENADSTPWVGSMAYEMFYDEITDTPPYEI